MLKLDVMKDIADANDAALMRQTRLNFDVLDEPFCLDVNVLIDEQVDE